MADSFVFYRSFYESVKELDEETRLAFYTAIIEYAFYGKTVELSLVPNALFTAIKPQLDRIVRISEANAGRHCSEYVEWRNAVFERDNYTCKMCGKRGAHINAHHIKPYAKYPSLRYNVENGVTLCKTCHYKIHRKKV